ncbi:Regulator of RNase E activity RraA [Pseudomonas flavescens]|uniref:Putative 4-hydroxy-4-methyl-2-oxoglutarate aldolase n=1 Tax=Phytopseudomonas flavescens TaxID=29435 RepID=A0A1G8KBT3_9GAMM|nr:RraA family protein [Pseudomonas flavescens]SDI40946.1 Regulator of RNase E activity RraA [Pseudomonas flavescens]
MSDLDSLVQRLAEVGFATFGHFLDDGFADPGLRAQTPGIRLIGRAATLQLADSDAIAMNQALVRLQAGEVLVVATGGDLRHACVGTVTVSAALGVGASGIVVDGLVTDVVELRQLGLPVFARGTSLLTTKLRGSETSRFGQPVTCGGVLVQPGDLVLGDDNGVMFISPAALADVIDKACASDQAEPGLLARLAQGEALASVLKTRNDPL